MQDEYTVELFCNAQNHTAPHLGFALSGEACAEGVEWLAGHRCRTRSQTTADEMNSRCLAVIGRLLVDQLCQALKTRKLVENR